MTVTHVYDERVAPGGTGYDAHLARYRRADAAVPAGASVLDAGSGAGFGAALLARRGRPVVGVDRSPEAVERAAAEHGDAVLFRVGDVTALPFADASFDAVTCFEVIEHVEGPAELVRELARVLRPGGLLCLSTPNARLERLHARRAGRRPNPYHVSPLRPRELRALLAGQFERVALYGQAEDRGLLHALLQALDPLGLRLRLAPARREAVRRVLARPAAGPPGSYPSFRFARTLAASAAITYAEARKGAR